MERPPPRTDKSTTERSGASEPNVAPTNSDLSPGDFLERCARFRDLKQEVMQLMQPFSSTPATTTPTASSINAQPAPGNGPFSASTPNNNTVHAPVNEASAMIGQTGDTSNIIASNNRQRTRPSGGAADPSALPIKAEPCAHCQKQLTAENKANDQPALCKSCYAGATTDESHKSVSRSNAVSRPQKVGVDASSHIPAQQASTLEQPSALMEFARQTDSNDDGPNVAPTAKKRPQVVKCQLCRKSTGPNNCSEENRYVCVDCFKTRRDELDKCNVCGCLAVVRAYADGTIKCRPCYTRAYKEKCRQTERERAEREKLELEQIRSVKRTRKPAANSFGTTATSVPAVASNARTTPARKAPPLEQPAAAPSASAVQTNAANVEEQDVAPTPVVKRKIVNCQLCDNPTGPEKRASENYFLCVDCVKDRSDELEKCSRCDILSKIYNRNDGVAKCRPCYNSDWYKSHLQSTREKPSSEHAPALKRTRTSASDSFENALARVPTISSNARVSQSSATSSAAIEPEAEASTLQTFIESLSTVAHSELAATSEMHGEFMPPAQPPTAPLSEPISNNNVAPPVFPTVAQEAVEYPTSQNQHVQNKEPVCKVCDASPFPPNQWSRSELVCEECYRWLQEQQLVCIECHQVGKCDESGRCERCAAHHTRMVNRQRFVEKLLGTAREPAGNGQSASSSAMPNTDSSM